jgi:hypothetical protein
VPPVSFLVASCDEHGGHGRRWRGARRSESRRCVGEAAEGPDAHAWALTPGWRKEEKGGAGRRWRAWRGRGWGCGAGRRWRRA